MWGVRSKDVEKNIIDKLNNTKILDPACGSGAFPMGMLHLISRTYERLIVFYYNKNKKHLRAFGKMTYNKYESKLNIIKNNLYGAVIEPMAIEIARLRAWLSLIVEEKQDVHPLPNLDFNFVCCNSLLKLDESIELDFGDNEEFEEKFNVIRNKYFEAHSFKEKEKLRKDFSDLYNINLSNSYFTKRLEQLRTWKPFDISTPADFFDSKVMFDTDHFDIVIGNPPYIHLESIKELSQNLYRPLNYKTYEVRGDMYALFYEMGINYLKKNGVLTYITSNKWMRADYGNSLRNFFLENTQPLLLIDLGSGVFDATVDTNILKLKKIEKTSGFYAVSLKGEYETVDFASIAKTKKLKVNFFENEPCVILSKEEMNIMDKINKRGTQLKKWIYQLITG